MGIHFVLVALDDEAEALVEELRQEEGLSVTEAPRRALRMLSDLERYAMEWDAQSIAVPSGDSTHNVRI